ncbi:AAA family ATPase, partial [Prevotella sp. MGM2]|uniref:AAA family ATPase n=1 Tax=Prevotella sp. MGM2 TaxID=2033406 RepID=UPI000D0C3CAA
KFMNRVFGLTQNKGDTQRRFVFIIDEINRGEISKIFGELFFSIDPGYRGKNGLVKTQYQNMITDKTDPFYDGFYVPNNVYIIGTMNDIDRSVESMDFAMRRRFAWEEIKANENTGMLDELQDMKDEVTDVMKRLNAAIWNEESNIGIEGLNAAYHIGGSYFCKLQLYLDDERTNKKSAYRHLWENHLKGVLFEYLRGTANATENLKMLESVYYNENGNNDIEG